MYSRIAAVAGTAVLLGMLVHASEGSKVADAAMQADVATVRALIAGGEDVNAAQGDGMTALHWAARRGEIDMVRMLLAAGANVRATTRLGNYTPLILASEGGHGAAIEALVAAGAHAQQTTPARVAPLALARRSRQRRAA